MQPGHIDNTILFFNTIHYNKDKQHGSKEQKSSSMQLFTHAGMGSSALAPNSSKCEYLSDANYRLLNKCKYRRRQQHQHPILVLD